MSRLNQNRCDEVSEMLCHWGFAESLCSACIWLEGNAYCLIQVIRLFAIQNVFTLHRTMYIQIFTGARFYLILFFPRMCTTFDGKFLFFWKCNRCNPLCDQKFVELVCVRAILFMLWRTFLYLGAALLQCSMSIWPINIQ